MAPPINKGTLKFLLSISLATPTISSNDGVINPDKPIRSQFSFSATSSIFSVGTMTPKSITSKLLHCNTTPTIFLPISWTSPFTVAITIFPFDFITSPSFSASINGTRWATAFFITLADFITWGRNIFPAPNRSPTLFMPSIRGPSITSSGLSASNLASSTSSIIYVSTPDISEWVNLSLTSRFLQSWLAVFFDFSLFCEYFGAKFNNFSVASSVLFKITSSTASLSSIGISS